MPKKIDDELKARAVRLVHDHQGEYSSLTAAAAIVAKQLGAFNGRENKSPNQQKARSNDCNVSREITYVKSPGVREPWTV